MRTKIFIAVLMLPALLGGQDFVAPEGVQREIAVEAPELKPTIDGIVSQIFNVDKPWQLLNPAAPASYGNGEKNVSKDISGGTPFQATTLTIVGVEW